jgi:ubiquitin-protein ligase
LQRARFGLWGESVGLIPNPNDGRRLRYDKNLDRRDIKPGVERILNNIKSLLDEAGRVDERYGSKADPPQGCEVSTSRGLDIFKGSFERFKSRIKKHQKDTSAWKVTRWAIHDADKFEGIIARLKGFVDGLEAITKSLGLLQEQHARLRQEIASISDTESLRLLRDASSRDGASDYDVPDTASRRLITVAESIIEGQTMVSSSRFTTTAESFVTARSRPSAMKESIDTDELAILGAWPKSTKLGSHPKGPPQRPPKTRPSRMVAKPSSSMNSNGRPNGTRADFWIPEVTPDGKLVYFNTETGTSSMTREFQCCQACWEEEHYECVVTIPSGSCARCLKTQQQCNFLPAQPVKNLPQHQRLINELIGKAKPRKPLSFAAGDADYGQLLSVVKHEDENYWLENSGKILARTNSGSSAAKRMFFELRDIRTGKVPFISAAPLDDSLDKVLASIEGPPDTPYEGGVFWITVKLSESDPYGPPLMRFHTKVYHPNISPQGYICANYKEKWNSVLSAGFSKELVKDPPAHWYPRKSTEPKWTLGSLLTALCGLLGSPDVDDPLVPEIAAKYLEDYEVYCENARLYTRKFATDTKRPDLNILHFLEDSKPNETAPDNDIKSLQDSPRGAHDIGAFKASEPTSWKADSASNADSDSIDPMGDDFPSTASQFLDWALLSVPLHTEPTGPPGPNSLIGILATLTFFEDDLEQFLRKARQQNLSHKLFAQPSDMEIVHALLLKADSFLQGVSDHDTLLDSPEEFFDGYTDVKDVCIDYLYRVFSTKMFKVVYDKSSASYELSIVSLGLIDAGYQWRIRRTWGDFAQLNDFISSHARAAELWNQRQGWRHFPSFNYSEPDPNVMGPLLEVALKRRMLFSKELLGHSEVISFLGPQRYRHSEYPLSTRLSVTTSEITLPLINIQSFFPSSALLGNLFLKRPATRLTLQGSTIWQTGQNLDLRLREASKPGKCHWRMIWYEAQETMFIQMRDITDVRIELDIRDMNQMHYRRIMSIYYNPNGALPRSMTLHLYFHLERHHDEWNEALLLFRRISPFLANFSAGSELN